NARIDAGGLHDAAVLGEVAEQHREAAVLGIGMRGVADDALLAVEIDIIEAAVLAEGDLRWHAARRSLVEVAYLLARRARDVPAVERIGQRRRMHRRHIGRDQAGAVEL